MAHELLVGNSVLKIMAIFRYCDSHVYFTNKKGHSFLNKYTSDIIFSALHKDM